MAKIDEVAKAAGVSISTVSYALSGKRPVSVATRQRVEAAVRDLDYRPNAGARMLAGRRTNIFALTEPFRPDTHAPTHMAFVLATSIAARRSEYDILLLTEEEASAGMRRVASSGLVDGVLVLDVAPDDERVGIARQIDLPTVFIGVPDDREGLVCVDLDFEAAASLAVDRFADAGHGSIALIGFPAVGYEKSNFPPRVRSAYARRAEERGLAHAFRASGDETPDLARVRSIVRDLVASGVTAIAVHSPAEVLTTVMDELGRHGLRVPANVSIIALANSLDPDTLPTPIDSVPLVAQESCDLAVELALAAVEEGAQQPGLHLLPPHYLDRGSVAAPPGA